MEHQEETTPFVTTTTTTSSPRISQNRHITFCSKLLFSFPAISLEALHVFHHTWVTKFFVDDIGYPPLSFAVFHATERSFGIVTYPFMGLLVDRTVLPRRCRGCSGRRRLFFYVWPVLLFISYLLIWGAPSQLAVLVEVDPTLVITNMTTHGGIITSTTPSAATLQYSIEPRYFGFITAMYLCGQFLKNLVPVDLPWMSLAAEATNDGVDRTELFATKSVVALFGLALGSIGPIWLLSGGNISHFQAFSKFVVIAGIILVASFWLLASHVVPAHETKRLMRESDKNSRAADAADDTNDINDKNDKYNANDTKNRRCCCDAKLHENPDVAGSSRQTRLPFVAGIVLCLDNEPYMRLWLTHAISSLGDVAAEGMFPFFVQYVLQAPTYETWVSALMCIGFACGLISTPFWMWISSEGIRSTAREEIVRTKLRKLISTDYTAVPKEWIENQNDFRNRAIKNRTSWLSFIDKRRVWLGGWLLNFPAALLGYLFASPGNVAYFCGLAAWSGLVYGGTRFLSRPIRADCIDYDQLRTGLRREGAYVMMMEILPHFLRIPSTALSLSMLTSAGYIPHSNDQPDAVKSTLVFIIFVVPLIASIISFLVATTYPIHDVVHRKIADSLERLSSGEQFVAEPITGGIVMCHARNHATNKVDQQQQQQQEGGNNTSTSTTGETTTKMQRVQKLRMEQKDFAMDAFLLSTVKNVENRSGIVRKEQFRWLGWGLCVVFGVFSYFWFVSLRSFSNQQPGQENASSKKLMKGHHEMHTVGAVLVTSGSFLLCMFHYLRLEPARMLEEMDISTLSRYIERKDSMNGSSKRSIN
jgi:Na+/melibiose symporter-like transporter